MLEIVFISESTMSNDKQLKIQNEEQQALVNADSFEKSLRESCAPEKMIQQEITARVKKEVFGQFAFSPDGTRIALKIAELVYIWDRKQGRSIQVLKHKSTINTIAFSKDGKKLFVIVCKTFLIQNIESGEIIDSFNIDMSADKIDVISDEIVIIKEGSYGKLTRLNLKTGEILQYSFHFWDYSISIKNNEIITTNFMHEENEKGKITKAWFAINFWNIETGKQIHDRRIDLGNDELTGIAALVNDREIIVFFKKEPVMLVVNQQSKNIRKFDFGYQIRTHMYKPVISPDGKYLLASGSIHCEKLYLIEIATGRILKIIDGKFDDYKFSPDGSEFAFDRSLENEPYPDRGVEIWNTATDEKTRILDLCMDAQINFVLSPMNERFVTDASNYDLKIWNIKNGCPQYTLSGHTQFINDSKFGPDGTFLASISRDKTVRIWDVKTGYCINKIYLDYLPRSLTFSPDGKYIAVAENHYQQKHKIEIIDIRTGSTVYKMEQKEYWGTCIEFSKTRHSLIISERTNSYKLSPVTFWDYETGRLHRFNLDSHSWHKQCNNSSFFSNIIYYQGQKILAIGESNKKILVFDIESGENILCFEGHKDEISEIAIHPSKPILVSSDDSNQIYKWNLETGERLQVFQGLAPCVWRWRHIRSLVISENEKWLIASSLDGMISYWDYRTGRLLATSYALDQGYLWTTPPDEFAPNGWLHTNRPDLISLIEMNREDQENPTFIYEDDQRFKDYMQIYNDQDIVMTRLNDWDRYQELLNIRLGNKERTSDFLLKDHTSIKLLLDSSLINREEVG